MPHNVWKKSHAQANAKSKARAKAKAAKDAAVAKQKKKLLAYHEAGHAILGALINDVDIRAKISIMPRGPAGGVTSFMPSVERLSSGLYSKEFLENRMCVALGGHLAEEIINGRENVTLEASNDFQQCTQVAKQMVMSLGTSPDMGRDFMGQGAPPMSQALKQQVDDEVKRIVDEQYQRGMKLLRDNMCLLDELANTLMEQEVSGEELIKLIKPASIEGELCMESKQMAFAASTGEEVAAGDNSKVAASAFCGTTGTPSRDSIGSCGAIARLGLATEKADTPSTSEEVLKTVTKMAADVSNGSALPKQVIQTASVQAMVALAGTAAPMPALADVLQPIGQIQPAEVQGVTCHRFVELINDGCVKRVDIYDMGQTAVARVNVAGRDQALICNLPLVSKGVIDKLVANNIAIDVYQPEKPLLLRTLGDVALPMLTIAGLLFLRSQSGGNAGGIPGVGNQGQVMTSPDDTPVKFDNVGWIDQAKEEYADAWASVKWWRHVLTQLRVHCTPFAMKPSVGTWLSLKIINDNPQAEAESMPQLASPEGRRASIMVRLLRLVPPDALAQELIDVGVAVEDLDKEGLVQAMVQQLS